MNILRLICIALLFVCVFARADQTTVIVHDAGATVPLAPYMAYMISGETQQGVSPDFKFPLVTSLKTGSITQPTKVFESKWMTNSLFIIGSDVQSKKWLKENTNSLIAAGSWGLVVSAKSEAEFKEMQTLCLGMPIAPMQDSWFENQLRLKKANVYPLWIDAQGVARSTPPKAIRKAKLFELQGLAKAVQK